MKKNVLAVLILALVVGFSGVSNAALYYENYVGNQKIGELDLLPASFYFNLAVSGNQLTNTSLSLANDVAFGTPDLESAFVRIRVADDGGFLDGWEAATVKIDFLLDLDPAYTIYDGNLGGLSSDILLTGGALNALEGLAGEFVTIRATFGLDLNFNDFCIKEVGIGAAPVPEPISMLLFGTGLAGVAGYVRRKLKG